MEVYLFGCKDTTLHVARFLHTKGAAVNLVTIDRELAAKNQVAGFLNLLDYPTLFKSTYVAKSYSLTDSQDDKFFQLNRFNVPGFCVGWQRLIPEYVLDRFPLGIHGMHGSARDLPFGKGRSPMNWSIIEGRSFFYTNLFKYQLGVDDGPIVDRAVFSISSADTAETMHFKNVLSMCAIIEKNFGMLMSGNVTYHSQNQIQGDSFYPKRTPEDGIIDWLDSVDNIDRLIRAVSPPFYGAIGYNNSQEVLIYRASIFYTDVEAHPFVQSSSGQVLDKFPNGKFLVRCSNGVLIVHEYSGSTPEVGDFFVQRKSPFERFSRNAYGFFDI